MDSQFKQEATTDTGDNVANWACDPGFQRHGNLCLPEQAQPSFDREIWMLQTQLMQHCFGLPPSFANGQNGPMLLRALMIFQAAYGLRVDGIYGPQTAWALAGFPNGRCVYY